MFNDGGHLLEGHFVVGAAAAAVAVTVAAERMVVGMPGLVDQHLVLCEHRVGPDCPLRLVSLDYQSASRVAKPSSHRGLTGWRNWWSSW